MCGVFGYCFKQDDQNVGIAERAALAAVLKLMNDRRGGDSWGYYRLKPNGDFDIIKGLGEMHKEGVRLLAESRLIMCHTRKATTGKVTVENCHPFEIDPLVGAHNGTVSNHEELNKQYNRNCAVDSMHLFHHIAESRPLTEIEGYGTIEYIDKKNPDQVWLCKMKHGQLTIAGIGTNPEDSSGVIWSSDGDHLKAALESTGLPWFTFKIVEGDLYVVRDGILYRTETHFELKSKNYGQKDFEKTGYTGTGAATRTGSRWNEYEDDEKFIAYLLETYDDEAPSQKKEEKTAPIIQPATNTQTASTQPAASTNPPMAICATASGIKGTFSPNSNNPNNVHELAMRDELL